MKIERVDGRRSDEFRRLSVNYDACEFAAGSVVFHMGRTKVLCSVNIQQGVPPFLRGKQRGWLTAEYAMLPAATPTRSMREACASQRSGRSVEISRLIGRVLRSIIRFDALGENTIVVDCDVLQADGGTRIACINGAYLALCKAVNRWLDQGIIKENIILDSLAGISLGIVDDRPLIDLTYEEDVRAQGDFNIVVTRSGKLIEVQGTAEQRPLSMHEFNQLLEYAQKGAQHIFNLFDEQQRRLIPISEHNTQTKYV